MAVIAVLVFLAPGLLILWSHRLSLHWAEHVAFAFALSYSIVFIASVILPVAHLGVDAAAVATAIVTGIAAWMARRRPAPAMRHDRRFAPIEVLVVAIVIALAIAGWRIEGEVGGEETLDLAAASRFADGQPITFDNASLFPSTRAVYVVQPYQLAIGAIARWSPVDTIIALVKMRALLVLLCATFLYALLRCLTKRTDYAVAAFVAVVAFIVIDASVWEMRSLFPFTRRGGFMAGVCVPCLMLLIVRSAERAGDAFDARRRELAIVALCGLMLAGLTTHPLESFTVLVFAAAVAAAALVVRRDTLAASRAIAIVLALFAISAAYALVQRRAVPEVTTFEEASKAPVRAELRQLERHPRQFVAGDLIEEAHDLLGGDIPESTAAVLGVPLLAAAAFIAPQAAAILVLAIVPLALVYATRGGYLLLSVLLSPDTTQDVFAYFGLLGLLGVGLGLTAVVHGVLSLPRRLPSRVLRTIALVVAGALLVAVVRTFAPLATISMLKTVVAHPRTFVLIGSISAVVVLVVSRFLRATQMMAAPVLLTPVFVALCAVPLAGLGQEPNDRVSLFDKWQQARSAPSVTEWTRYYPVLQQTMRPTLPVPRAVVDGIRQTVPPRRVLLADPEYSCALAALVDAYCVNPAKVYGHYFLSGERYLLDYTHGSDNGGPDWHPFFNDVWPMEPREPKVLRELRVDYLFADPRHAELIERKLRALPIRADAVQRVDGFVLYRIDRR